MQRFRILAALLLVAVLAVPVAVALRAPAQAAGTTYIDIINDNLVVGGGTPIKKVKSYVVGVAPTASTAAVGIKSYTIVPSGGSLTGINQGDNLLIGYAPTPTSLCPVVGARATAANTVVLDFAVLTAAVCTGATGTYDIIAITV